MTLFVATPWDLVTAIIGVAWQGEFHPPESSLEGRILAVILILGLAYFVFKLHQNWDGAVTESQAKQQRPGIPPSLIDEGRQEFSRIVHGKPPEPAFVPARSTSSYPSLEGTVESVAFRDLVRQAFCERWPDHVIDPADDWYANGGFWVGYDRRTKHRLVLLPTGAEFTNDAQDRVASYMNKLDFAGAHGTIWQIRRNPADPTFERQVPFNVEHQDFDSLLDELVDFTDYSNFIREAVETRTLPNSELTLRDTFTPARISIENQEKPESFETFALSWLAANDQRHLALLGEYGEGKSTSSLLLTYRLLVQEASPDRVPLLIELRGKSPKTMAPEELLGAWGARYGISGKALMILHRAGRLLLIFEGFDEMDALGDQYSRYAHFASLWSFSKVDRAKILLTGRPELFLDDHELRRSLGVHPETGIGPFTQVLRLARFDREQILAALRSAPKAVAQDILGMAEGDPSFLELASRPSLLQQVSTIWNTPELQARRDSLTSAQVIDLFLKSVYRRQSLKVHAEEKSSFMALSAAEIEFFTNSVAIFMLRENSPNQIRGPDLHRVAERMFLALPDDFQFPPHNEIAGFDKPLKMRLPQDNAVEIITTHIRSYGILVRDYSGFDLFKFAHKSYFELLAAVYAEEQVTRRQDPGLALIAKTIPVRLLACLGMPVVRKFFCELISGKTGSDADVYDKCRDTLLIGRYGTRLCYRWLRHALWIRYPCWILYHVRHYAMRRRWRRYVWTLYHMSYMALLAVITLLMMPYVSGAETNQLTFSALTLGFATLVAMPVRHVFLVSPVGRVFWSVVQSLDDERRLQQWGGKGSVLAARLAAMEAADVVDAASPETVPQSAAVRRGRSRTTA